MIAAVAEAEPIVRGAIVQELLVAARYGWELTQQALREEGVDPAEYGAASQDANALDRIIRDLKAQHYTFATVAQVMA